MNHVLLPGRKCVSCQPFRYSTFVLQVGILGGAMIRTRAGPDDEAVSRPVDYSLRR
jgi:hypothetical protein